MKSFWSRWAVPSNATLVVVGDVTRAELQPKLEQAFGGWKGTAAPELRIPAVSQHGKRTIYLVNKKGAAQSVIVCGHVGAARGTSDYAAIEAVNNVLGGNASARLFMNLREDKGYTYGAYSRFDYQKAPGAFLAYASVATNVTAPAVQEFVKEIEGIAGQKPVTEEELKLTRNDLVNGYARQFETPGQIAGMLTEAALYGLPDDALEVFPVKVGRLSLDQARDIAAKYIHPDRLAIVVVGDREAVLPALEKLDIGPVVELDKEGNPLK
ncbi:MAG: pitrilysin family protein [Acidobacteriota bacterium]